MASANTQLTLFDLPNSPEQIGVVLQPANLRRLDYSALDFGMMQRAMIEYIKTYFPTFFNDFVAANGIIMVTELVSYLCGLISQRGDVLFKNAFLPTAYDTYAISNHLALINNALKRATPAVVDITATVDFAALTPINIPPGTQFSLVGPDGNPVIYELYRAPGDFSSNVTIPPGKRGVVGYGLEGSFATPFFFQSAGGTSQTVQVDGSNILSDPIFVELQNNNEYIPWQRLVSVATAGPNDTVYQVAFNTTGMLITFGDNIAGKAPLSGQTFRIRYRTGGGQRGRIASSAINESRSLSPDAPVTAPVQVTFQNLTPSSGGIDAESAEVAKVRAPAESATLGAAVTASDYAVLAKGFNHAIFGSVLKAVATLRTSLNANLVELYVLAAGPENVPVLPSAGLKQGIVTYFDDINVLTDEIRALDGAIKAVSLRADVIINRNADPTQVKSQVDSAIQAFFDVSKWDMGQELYLASLYEVVQTVDGVKFCKFYEPVDDILASNVIDTETGESQIGFNQIITLGQTNIKFYFEK
jgi:hypothetical protein